MPSLLTDRQRYLRTITEASWQNVVVHFAREHGWLVHFVPDRLYRRSFVSGIPMDLGDRGFPDLVLVGHGRLLFRELKTETGTLQPTQAAWRDALVSAGCDWKLWRPSDGDEMEADLCRP